MVHSGNRARTQQGLACALGICSVGVDVFVVLATGSDGDGSARKIPLL